MAVGRKRVWHLKVQAFSETSPFLTPFFLKNGVQMNLLELGLGTHTLPNFEKMTFFFRDLESFKPRLTSADAGNKNLVR